MKVTKTTVGHRIDNANRFVEREYYIERSRTLARRVDLELQSDVFFDETVGDFRGGKLVAYNRFVPGIDPQTGKPIHWLTVAGIRPGDARAAWLLIRHADGQY